MATLIASCLILLGPLGFFILGNHREVPLKEFSARTGSVLNGAVLQLPLSQDQSLQAANALAAVENTLSSYAPYRDWSVAPPEVDAKAAIIMGAKTGKVLYERNMHERLPIASLNKLATALSLMDEVLLTDEVKVSRHAVSTGGDFGNLVVGEVLTAHDVLRAMLIASSNDAAVAFAEHLSEAKGVRLEDLMNGKASTLELANTHFSSVSGLEDGNNYSTAEDVAKLLKAALDNSTLSEILKTAEVEIRSVDGKFTHHLTTSNKLLNHFDGVIAGKTGYTSIAGGNLALLARNGKTDDDFLVVVLGSKDEETRFEAAESLINWVNAAYRWQ